MPPHMLGLVLTSICLLLGGSSIAGAKNVAGAGAIDFTREANPRYVLCANAATPAVPLEHHGELRVFAASIAGGEDPRGQAPRAGRPRTGLGLHAALILDGSWQTQLPTFNDARADAGHAKQVSYAKCLSPGLPNETEIFCRTGTGERGRHFAENVSWGVGRLMSFRNSEVRHDFAVCAVGRPAIRWRRPPGPPKRLHMELGVKLPGPSPLAVLSLELCHVDRPPLRASFCSQPLWGLPAMREALPWVMEDWLAYHLGHLGFEHAEIYDLDGSFADALEPWVQASLWHSPSVTYHRKWPEKLAPALANLSGEHPYCTETWAYAHCITTHRALSRWVAILHAPDEYLVMRKNPTKGALLHLLDYMEERLPVDMMVPFLQVNAVSFARGGPGSELDTPQARGSVLAASHLRMAFPYLHMPLLDPATCVCAGPHLCYAETGERGFYSGVTQEVRPTLLILHHYVEMLPHHKGRCSTLKECTVPDSSASYVVDLLRDL